MAFNENSSIDDKKETSNVVYLEEDSFILRGIIEGQAEALLCLYKKYSTYVRRVIFRISGNCEDDIEDIMQEVFTAAFCSADSVRNENNLKSWLASIAVYKSIDYIRAQKKRRWLLYFSPMSMPEVEMPAGKLEDAEALEAVYNILDTMPPQERVPFVLRRIEKMSLIEIAETINVSLATTKRRIVAANRRFVTIASHYPQLENWLDRLGEWKKL